MYIQYKGGIHTHSYHDTIVQCVYLSVMTINTYTHNLVCIHVHETYMMYMFSVHTTTYALHILMV